MYLDLTRPESASASPHKANDLLCAPLPEKTLCTLLCELGGPQGECEPGLYTSHHIDARSTLRHPMERTDDIIVITEGWACTSISIADGRRQMLSYTLPGEIVPTSYLFVPIPDHITVAITAISYLKFKRDWVLEQLATRPHIFRRFLRHWIDDHEKSEQLVFDLGRGTVVERVVRLLWDLKSRLAGAAGSGDSVDFPLRQRQIADSIGTTPLKAGKVLKDLASDGLIALSERTLTILNETEMRRLIGR